jgi:hypothetical protein
MRVRNSHRRGAMALDGFPPRPTGRHHDHSKMEENGFEMEENGGRDVNLIPPGDTHSLEKACLEPAISVLDQIRTR